MNSFENDGGPPLWEVHVALLNGRATEYFRNLGEGIDGLLSRGVPEGRAALARVESTDSELNWGVVQRVAQSKALKMVSVG